MQTGLSLIRCCPARLALIYHAGNPTSVILLTDQPLFARLLSGWYLFMGNRQKKSACRDTAAGDQAPVEDILGQARSDGRPDIGAYESNSQNSGNNLPMFLLLLSDEQIFVFSTRNKRSGKLQSNAWQFLSQHEMRGYYSGFFR